MKKRMLLATMLVMVLGIGGTALAQEMTEDTTAEETTTEDTATEDTTTGETTTEDTTTEDTTTTEETVSASPEFTLGADGTSVDRTDSAGVTNIPCFNAFREEQEELAVIGTVPTTASDAARACEGFGLVNPYPVPYFFDTDGFLYTYDPIEGIYSAPDPANGVVYIYSPANGAFYTYDPVNGVYL